MDESGTHAGSPLAIVGGIILSEQGYYEFQRAWCETLTKSKYGVKVFHGADCDAGSGEFKGWTQEKKQELSFELATIVSSHAANIIAYGIKPEDFNSVWEELSLGKIGIKNDIYRILLQLCWHNLGVYAQELPTEDTLAIFVEKGNKRASFINDLYLRVNADRQARDILNIKQIEFVGKDVPPLQGADLLVHETFKYHPNLGTDIVGDALRELTKNYKREAIKLLDIDGVRLFMLELRERDKDFIKRKPKRTPN